MRTVSLLPAATEIMGTLGMLPHLVGVSHECDYPPAVTALPRVTGCELHGAGHTSSQIDDWVSSRLAEGQELFTLDEPLLRRLQPELILTQRLCDVCAPAYGSVAAMAQTLPDPPTVLNLEPSTLDDILLNIQAVAEALGAPAAGDRAVAALRERIAFVRKTAANAKRTPRMAVIEWLAPVFCSGHWTPELVELAGGQEVLGRKWQDSVRMTWADVAQADPEVLVIACCGQTADRAIADWNTERQRAEVQALRSVRAGAVYFADGNAYFSRPGPRIVDTLEILASILHPELFAGLFPDRGVRCVSA